MKTQPSEHPCPKCRQQLALVTDYPERGAGCVIAVIGLIVAPVLIGIPILIWGVVMTGRMKRQFHCYGCGTVFPVREGRHARREVDPVVADLERITRRRR